MAKTKLKKNATKPLKVLFLSSEVNGFSKSGGLADISRALPLALKNRGHDIRVVTPYYRSVADKHSLTVVRKKLSVSLGGKTFEYAVRRGTLCDANTKLTVYFVDEPEFFFRKEYYVDASGKEYSDNAERFAFFSKAALSLCHSLKFKPDILHANDWHAALALFYLKEEKVAKDSSTFQKTRSVLSLHNAGFQGRYSPKCMEALGLSQAQFNSEQFEEFGNLNLLKGGIAYADQINTVSPGYAEELLTILGGHGLDQALLRRKSSFRGILNGCDYEDWNPELDSYIAKKYSSEDLSGKAQCKSDLQQKAGIPVNANVPILGMVSRLGSQKGFDYLLPVISKLAHWEVQLIFLGSGDPQITEQLRLLEQRFPQKFRFFNTYSNECAHQIEAGSDIFLMPSLYEPCGLNQIYSLKYGTLPLVRFVGGLKDTVSPYEVHGEEVQGTGFVFHDPTPDGLESCIGWAVNTYYDRPEHFRTLISNAMNEEFSWSAAAHHYETMYRDAQSS